MGKCRILDRRRDVSDIPLFSERDLEDLPLIEGRDYEKEVVRTEFGEFYRLRYLDRGMYREEA